ncbi:ATP-dependent DNA helicase RecG [Sinobacterium norvegicum]|uniref:ATP-dependent DNA helicase RecG n=1 Tax=Sinobacterium norvegicum TaxID=1641715 RepID=A0ABM9AIZ5_9GAMM|nr:ATP-dependent DNA helicase RecG [Sinobacterium norvegicum]CAH0993128.1 ATP-dependent DNA helicase RecG [Sinobacterium norvegicum]
MSDYLDQLTVSTLKGVGPKMVEKLNKIGVFSVQDVLFHLPMRYQDRSKITPLAALQMGSEAVIEGEVKGCNVVMGRRRSLVCKLQDHTGTVTLRFFHFTAAQKNNLTAGTRIRCFGEARRGASGIEFYHPEYKLVTDSYQGGDDSLTPVYPSTEGMHQAGWRKLTEQALLLLKKHRLREWLPENCGPIATTTLEQAIQFLHKPPTDANTEALSNGKHPIQQRLAFEELLAHNLSLLKLRNIAQLQPAPKLPANGKLQQQFLDALPFQLTAAQQKVSTEILTDIASSLPMLRLVQGDVGSGKTVVAAMAAMAAVENDYQVAIMAPTEILAEQHLINFTTWFQPLGIKTAWLSGKLKGKKRQQQLDLIASGEAPIVVGTHALFQQEVHFAKLGLAIIDEQHRFGVHQRLALREKGAHLGLYPHQLIMTATPIPRTLAMSAYADLDCSIIDELPPGRTPINTVVMDNSRREQVIERVRQNCIDGRQAYWVCTLIEESEQLQAQAAEDTYEELQKKLKGLGVGLVHGRMKPAEKADIMAQFKRNQLQLLVATTVIEVGVDVPNASLMIIENPERLGLAQLHQLRGRVGRGSVASHCVLMYQPPLSQQSRERLTAMRESNDGFYIAEKDLELRGPGEVLGTRQTGLMQFKMADLTRDQALLEPVKAAADTLIAEYPENLEGIISRWLPDAARYGHA